MVTEVLTDSWSTSDLRPYFDIVLESFGTDRIMFGSDWPVCLLKSGYKSWIQTVLELLSGHCEEEQNNILYENARSFYDCED